jgi:hypothetical protein
LFTRTFTIFSKYSKSLKLHLLKCKYYLHLSKCNFNKNVFKLKQSFSRNINTLHLNIEINSRFEYVSELKMLKEKAITNTCVYECSMDAIISVYGYKLINYDFSKIKFNFCTASFTGLNGFSGVDCIYISLNELLAFHNNLNYGLNSEHQLTIIKLNFMRLVQHEITHVIFRDIANDVNASLRI